MTTLATRPQLLSRLQQVPLKYPFAFGVVLSGFKTSFSDLLVQKVCHLFLVFLWQVSKLQHADWKFVSLPKGGWKTSRDRLEKKCCICFVWVFVPRRRSGMQFGACFQLLIWLLLTIGDCSTPYTFRFLADCSLMQKRLLNLDGAKS